MTRAAKQKQARQSTAAYAASQPLFDALRIGFTRVGEQKASLSIARDLVQHLHVKLPDSDSWTERDRHHRYIDCAVKAFRSATEIYADVFQALAKVTAAEAAEGRGERNGHAEFAEMARTAAEAKSAARMFVLYEDIARADAETEAAVAEEGEVDEDSDDSEDIKSEESDSDDNVSASGSSTSNPHDEEKEDQAPVDTTPTNSILLQLLGKRPLLEEPPQKKSDQPPHKAPRLSEKIKYDSQGRKILWDRGAEEPNVPYGTLGSSEKKAWKAEKRRQRRDKKQAKRAGKMVEEAKRKHFSTGANGVPLKPDRRAPKGYFEGNSKPVFNRDYISLNGTAGPEPEPASLPTREPAQPAVAYEDVSAEVEARLKAKEEKKAVLKKEKKRKRESGDSFEAAGEAETKPEKPSKKKVRSEGVDGEADVMAKKEKRKKHEREADEGVDGEGRKKRKKSRE